MSEEQAVIPRHVAIIMDGNGRWAKSRHLPRSMGHRQGALAVRELVRYARDMGVRYLTLFCFSSENWSRPKEEIDSLMSLLKEFFEKEFRENKAEGVRIRALGQIEAFPKDVYEVIKETVEKTKKNDRLDLIMALNYGSRTEIALAAKNLARDIKNGVVSEEGADETLFSKYLFLPDVPDVDLLIRTSGEQRLSNFLLWQSAYAEFVFTDTLWPDFNKKHFKQALDEFQSRQRRFGGIREGE